jgi:outer membrane immunogenic protein
MWARSLIAGTLLSGLAGPLNAADMPLKARPAPPTPSIYNWSGFYVGGNVGYGWAKDTGGPWNSVFDPSGAFLEYLALGGNVLPGVTPRGTFGGVQVGYSWQFASSWVIGLVADLQTSNLHGYGAGYSPPNLNAQTVQTNDAKIGWIGTARGKVGMAVNNWLFYGTGGLAYGRVRSTVAFTCYSAPCDVTVWEGSSSGTKPGWAAGAGVEVGLSPNWTIGLEYLYVNLGSIDTRTVTGPGVSFGAHSDFAANLLRGTVSLKFP